MIAPHGILSTADLAARGLNRRALEEALRAGHITRIRIGWYALPDADPEVVEAVRAGGALTCAAALRHHGVWALRQRELHVAVPPHGRVRDHVGLRCHWSAASKPPVLEALEALRDYAGCASRELVLAAADSVLHERIATRGEVVAALRGTRAEALAGVVDARSESGLESIARYRLRGLRIAVRPQVQVPGVGRVDLLIGDRLVLELDGRQWHGSDRFEADRLRDRELHARGFLVLRASLSQVLEWRTLEEQVLRIVRRRAHRWRTVTLALHADAG